MKDKEKWIKRQQEILDAARAAGRDLTVEEKAEWDELQRQIEAEPDHKGGEPTSLTPGVRMNVQDSANTPTPAQTAATGTEDAQRAVAEERQRINDILALCRQTGMDPEEHIRSGATMDTVRSAAVEYMIQHGAPVQTDARDSDRDNFRDAARDALLMQAGVEVENPAQGAEDYRGMSLRDILIESMARSGMGTTTELLRRSRNDLWDTASRDFLSPTADFPAILDNAINKSIVQQYALVPASFESWTSKGSLTDFKNSKAHEYALGGGEFHKVSEGGELKHSTLQTDLLPNRKLETYGTQFTMTREAFINDDIGFLAAMPGQFASRAKRTINRQVYEKLYQNPAEYDGVPLFDDAHRNLISDGSAPGIAVLEKMIQMMGCRWTSSVRASW